MSEWDRGAAPLDLDSLKGRPCWLGVDMSAVDDLTAVVAAFKDDDGGFTVLAHTFAPEDGLQAKADKVGVDYPGWAKEGHLTPTPGNVIDPRAVERCIRELAETYQVEQIGFDRAYARDVMVPLGDEGFPVVVLQQGWVTQSPALNVLEAAILSGKLRHGGNPVLRWCMGNVVIQTDSAGNRLMHKGKSEGKTRDHKIDAAAATWMAVSLAAAGQASTSIYDDPNFNPDDWIF